MYNDHVDSWEANALQHIADELAIKNLLDTLNLSIYSSEERKYINDAIKTHALMNAERVHDFAQKCEEQRQNSK